MSPRRLIIHRTGGLLHGVGLFRWLHHRRLPDAISVVMYHGLLDVPLPVRDWCFLHVDRFAAQMEYLERHFRVMHLEEALDPSRPPAERPVACVTFDDGFASVHDLALPVLERLSVPATVFVVTGLVDKADTVWSARLHQAICETTVPEVHFAGRRFPLGNPKVRAQASAALQQGLKPLPKPAFDAALQDVLSRLGFGATRPIPIWEPFRMLRRDEIRRMSRSDLVRVGAHTASNQILTRTTKEEARREIETSVADVARLVERPSRAFAYPNGTAADFDGDAISALRDAGIQYGMTTIEGPNVQPLDPFRVRRYGIGAADSAARFAGLVHHTRATLSWRRSTGGTAPSATGGRGTRPRGAEETLATSAESPTVASSGRTTVAVAICTHYRNGPLEVLLRALKVNAERLGGRAAVGVVVVDDSADRCAREVVDRFESCFELGIHYRVSGHHNISLARNMAIGAASEIADWVAMTDDDCEPEPAWLETLLDVQRRTGADAIAGRYRRRAPPGAPSWLSDEPFLEIALMGEVDDGGELDMAGTNNSLVSSRWWKAHPEVRFDPRLGVAGGEDVVFYRTAHAAGLRIHAAPRAVVWEEQPPTRTSLAYQLWHFFWLGNSSFVTRHGIRETSPARMFLQGGNQVRRALTRPIARVLRGQSPQLRYSLAVTLNGIGLMAGIFGLRVSHH